MQEEIDLRPYFRTLLARWRLIVLMVVLTTTAAVYMALQQPESYTATAGILILRTRTSAGFDSNIRTLTEVDFPEADRSARRRAMVKLITSPDVEARVVAAMGDMLDESQQKPGGLKGQIEVLETSADIIEIEATSGDGEHAAHLANVWAEEAANYINQTYASEQNAGVVAAIGDQVAEAQQHYQSEVQALANFQSQTKLPALKNQVMLHQTALQYYASRRLEQAQLLDRAELLRAQVGAPGADAASLAPAVVLLFSQAASYTPLQFITESEEQTIALQQTAPLQVQIPTLGAVPSVTSLAAQLDTFITTLSSPEWHQRLQAAENEALTQHNVVQQQLEQEQEQLRQFEESRELAWEAYDKLRRRSQELEVNVGIPPTEVRFALSAITPGAPESASVLRTAALGFVAGLILGVAGAFLADLVAGGNRRLVPAQAR